MNSIRGFFIALCCVQLLACSPAGKETVIAEVGEKKITQSQLDQYLALKRVDKNRPDLVKKFTQEFLRKEALAQSIAQSGTVDLPLLEAELNETRKELLVGRYFEKYLADKVTDEAIANYYSGNVAKYTAKKALVSHILIRTAPDASEQERQAKYTRAHEAYSQLQTGASFESVAEKYSEDAISKKKGGSLGWISQGAIAQTFSGQVFEKLSVNQVSEPVLTQFGYHIIKLVEGPAEVKKPLEKVKGDIRYELRRIGKEAELERLAATVKIIEK